jgi:hypothetical protein
VRAYPRVDGARAASLAGKGSPSWPRPARCEREIGTFSGAEARLGGLPTPKRGGRTAAVRTLRRATLVWLAAELGAGILALTLLVALLPAVAVLLAQPLHPAMALMSVLSVSLPLAGLLGASAIRLAKEVATSQ